MAKSESTKYRLAEAMKTCMKTTSVDDITIRQIVEVCGVTRQTFYRNFLDKYDLITGILTNFFLNHLNIWAKVPLFMTDWSKNLNI